MTYVINKYSGAILVSIPDRTLNTTATSIKLPGRDLPRYGEPIVENLVWMLENFAGASPPAQAMQGQIWYDTQSDAIRVYNGSTWTGTGKVSYGSTAPDSPENGQLWYHSAKKQLYSYDISSPVPYWVLVGPPGSIISDDDIVPLTNRSSMDTTQVQDTLGGMHHILRMNISGTTVAIVSKDPEFTPTPVISGFGIISPGITLNSSIPNNKFRGTATLADAATSANNLAGVAASSFMRTDQTNTPTTTNTFNLGSVSARYATVFATTFDGTATSALYADVAERYHADAVLDAGTVVCVGGVNEITTCETPACDQVLGVISTAPAVCMNSQAGTDQTHPYVALLGRCPVRVKGEVRKGDRLMSSDQPGVAEKWDPASGILTILGRSLETKLSVETDLVEAIVGVK